VDTPKTNSHPLNNAGIPATVLEGWPWWPLAVGTVAILLFAPIPFGSVQTWSWTVIGMVVAALWAFFAMVAAVRWGAFRPRLPLLVPILVLAAFVALQIIPLPRGVVAAVSPAVTQHYDQAAASLPPGTTESVRYYLSYYPWATREALVALAVYAGFFWLIVNVFNTPARIRRLAAIVVCAGGAIALYGLTEYFTGSERILFYRKTVDINRVTGTYVSSSSLAAYLAVLLPVAVAYALACRSSRPVGAERDLRLAQANGSLRWYTTVTSLIQRTSIGQLLLLFLVLAMAVALALSFSRGGLAALAIGGLTFVVLARRRHRRRSWRFVLPLVAAGLVVTVALLAAADPVWTWLIRGLELEGDLSTVNRLKVWNGTVQMISSLWASGSGLGTFRYAFPAFLPGGINLYFDHAHQEFLELVAEVGIPGAAAALWLLVALIVRVARGMPPQHQRAARVLAIGLIAALVAVVSHAFVDFPLHIPAIALTAIAVTGMLVASLKAPLPVAGAGRSLESPARRFWRLALHNEQVATAPSRRRCASSVANGGALATSLDPTGRDAKRAEYSGLSNLRAIPVRLGWAATGVVALVVAWLLATSYTSQWHYYSVRPAQQATLNPTIPFRPETRIAPRKAAASLEAAYRADPWNALAPLALAQLYEKAAADGGTRQQVQLWYARALRCAPAMGRIYLKRGLFQDRHGDRVSARSDFDRAVALEPANAKFRVIIGRTLLHRGDLSEGPRHLAAAVRLDARQLPTVLGLLEPFCTGPGALVGFMPQNDLSERLFVMHFYSRSDMPAALEASEAVIRRNPRSASAYYVAGLAHHAQGDSTASIQAFRKALQIDPSDSWWHFYFGRVLAEAGRHQEAVEQLEHSLVLEENNPGALTLLGSLYADLGKTNRAMGAYASSLRLHPDNAETREALHALRRQAGIRDSGLERQ